jgi:ketosteroid isomerase-like protein
MKKLGPVFAVLAFFSLFSWTSANAAPADEKAITNVEHKLADATSVQEAMKYYDPTDEVTVFDMGGPTPEYTGQKAVRADFEKAFAGVKNVKVRFIELKVVTDGKLGMARSIQHLTATSADGKPVDITFRQTDFLHKVNGQWKILHQHISVPIDMATGKAEMASKTQ